MAGNRMPTVYQVPFLDWKSSSKILRAMQGSMDISNLAYCSSEGKRLGNTDLTDVVIDAKIVKIIYA